MFKNKKVLAGLLILIFILIIILGLFYFYSQGKKTELKQMIFIGIDGMQVSNYNNLLQQEKLPNFKKIITDNGENNEAIITGHTSPETAPGNAELLTGLGSTITGISDNKCGDIIPRGLTIFERLSGFDSKINLGSIYGKETCYIPLSILSNAKSVISWWQDKKTYPQNDYVNNKCTNSNDVILKSLEFIKKYRNQSFYLYIYLGGPDCAGHTFGVPSTLYDESLINVDSGLGYLLDYINSVNLKPQIIISGDHGWNVESKNHNIENADTMKVVLITNNHNLIDKDISPKNKKQCDIAPTILNYFGMNSGQYSDITQFGCESLILNK